MPEIPEIETVCHHLRKNIQGKQIQKAVVFRPKAINIPAETFIQQVSGQTITQIQRRAKFLILSLSNQFTLIVHFMLEGYVKLFSPSESVSGSPSLLFTLETGEQWAFFKMTLGYIHLIPTTDSEQISELRTIGPEPLAENFGLEDFCTRLKGKRGMIKPLLMDQHFIAGIGNVYSNEILFCAGILPTRKVNSFSDQEAENIYHCLRKILKTAVKYGGVYDEKFSSNDTFTGGYVPFLKVAYRTGEPCSTCGTPILTEKVGGRNAYFCPRCQK